MPIPSHDCGEPDKDAPFHSVAFKELSQCLARYKNKNYE